MAKNVSKSHQRAVNKSPAKAKSPQAELHQLNQEVQAIWNRNADFWDERMGEGNAFHKSLIEPVQLEFLKVSGGEHILDAACGNGQFARKLADQNATVFACDASDRMIAHARARSKEYAGRIEYKVIDCCDRQQLLKLGGERFDRVVCTMALMDMTTIEPLVLASARL